MLGLEIGCEERERGGGACGFARVSVKVLRACL